MPCTKDESADEVIIELAQKLVLTSVIVISMFLTVLLNQTTLIQIQVLLPNFILER